MSILYIGAERGTSLDRANALRRLGHEVDHVDLRTLLPRTPWVSRVAHKLGGQVFGRWLVRALPAAVRRAHYDLCYVDGGALVSPRVIELLRRYTKKIINYNIDDPLGVRDGAKFKAYRQSVGHYDLCVVMRAINVSEAKSLGAKNVMRVSMSADEVAHAPKTLTQADRDRWNADVLFLGTWFPERGPFLLDLVKLGVPLTLRGANWHKAPEWSMLRSYWKGGPVVGDDYANAIQCAKVNLGLLSKGNRDLHTTRSLEIPALGGLLCAERTTEHLEMYLEGKEALFWSTAAECASACRSVLNDESLRRQIAAAGHARSLVNGNSNERVMRSVIERACASMTVKRSIIYAMSAMALLAFPCQAIIDPSAENIASACLVLASSLGMLVYLGCTDALKTHPLSSFAIFGFCVTTQFGALIVQTLAWTPLRSSLYDSMYTFGTLAFYQAIGIGVHVGYRFFSAPKRAAVHILRGLLDWSGVYLTPSCGALWIMGLVGGASYVVYANEALYLSPVGKVGMGFSFLAWAPFLIPFYLLEVGDTYCNRKLNRVLLIAYGGLLVLLGLALNTRGVMFFGIATVGLLYLLAALRSNTILKSGVVVRIGVIAIVVALTAGPLSDLVTAMAIARGLGNRVPVAVKIDKTFEVWRRPDLIAAYRAYQAAAVLSKAYDEHYIENPILTRFVYTKFHDNSLHFARKVTSDDAQRRLQKVTIEFFWGALPAPVLRLLGVNVDKLALGYSMGDYLPYLSGAGYLGGHRIGSMFGQGKALFGSFFPFVYAGICLALFGIMDLLTVRKLDRTATISALGLLHIWSYFVNGIVFEGLHEAVYFLVRTFWQSVLIYSLVFGIARLMLCGKARASPLRNIAVLQ